MIKNIIPIMIEVRPSTILPGEVGLFAVRALSAGTIVGDAKQLDEGSTFHPWSDFSEVDPLTQKKIMECCLGTAEGFVAPKDFNYLTVPWSINHSCEYNVGFDDESNFVLTRDVAANEELFWDYGMGEANPNFSMQCRCGSKKCRGIITGNDWKNEEFVEKNKRYFLRTLLSK